MGPSVERDEVTYVKHDWAKTTLALILDSVAEILGRGNVKELHIIAGDPFRLVTRGRYESEEFVPSFEWAVLNIPIQEFSVPKNQAGFSLFNQMFEEVGKVGQFPVAVVVSSRDALKEILGKDYSHVGAEAKTVMGIPILSAPAALIGEDAALVALAVHRNFPYWKSIKLLRMVVTS